MIRRVASRASSLKISDLSFQPPGSTRLRGQKPSMETSEITEAQLLRADASRLAALAKRKALAESATNPEGRWGLSKCRKLTVEGVSAPTTAGQILEDHNSGIQLAEKFKVRLEICSPDSFSATPLPVKGFTYPGEDECLQRLSDYLINVVLTHYTQSLVGGKACVYKLSNYDAVLRCLKSVRGISNVRGIEYEEIPWGTFNVIEKLSHSVAMGRWLPCRPEHFPDYKVDELIAKLPKKILDAVLPFQLDGIKFGLQRGGRCLIADEMGLGKTLQAIAIACSFMNEGPLLVVCPAVLRFSWAEELERWFPCLPSDIHLVFGHQNNPSHLKIWPKVVVISFKMLHHLRKTMLDHDWGFLIVDESHNLRCSRKSVEPEEIRAVLDVAMKIHHIVLLSGTPSLSRPGLLGKNKFDFAKTYCGVNFGEQHKGKFFKDFSRGTRLEELSILLKQTVMIRRLKEHVMVHLPPKRRQIIRLLLKKSDIASAKDAVRVANGEVVTSNASNDLSLGNSDQSAGNEVQKKFLDLSYQELGIAKISGFLEWLSLHPVLAASDGDLDSDISLNSHKMIIFAHHHKVLNKLQEYLSEKRVTFVQIDGNTLPRDRQSAVVSFQTSFEVKIAIIGITAGGVGLNLSAAKTVVFLELPPSSSWMLQAEDRAHRRGQTNAVNIYYFCAKDSMDDLHWQHLSRSLYRVSSTTNGKRGAIREIAVEDVSYLGISDKTGENYIEMLEEISCSELPSAKPMKGSGASEDDSIQLGEYSEKPSPLLNDGLGDENGACSLSQEKVNDHVEGSISIPSTMDDGEPADAIQPFDNFSNLIDSLQFEGTQALTVKVGGGDESENPATSNEQGPNLEDCLRFEVSKYTGRIHLYSCILGADTRPRPLFQSFQPEELHSQSSPILNNDKYPKDTSLNASCREVLLSFLNQWNGLRPIQRRKLLGRPLQLPLAIELCCLDEGVNHNAEGVLKGKSKRRTTPLLEISHPLPANAVWKTVHLCVSNDKKAREYTQGWLDDEPLCKLCQLPCRGKTAKAPEFFEDLFCNLGCYEEYRLRTSSRFLRQELFQIEHGVCTNCQLDCHKLVKCLKPLSLERRQEYILKKAPKLAKRKKMLDKLVNEPNEGNAWHADHIVPVFRGGGECMLENMRTLCIACHSEVTAAQNAERRSERAEARKRLKLILKNLEKGLNVEVPAAKSKDQVPTTMDGQERVAEDELLVEVPGSAYSAEAQVVHQNQEGVPRDCYAD